MDFHNLRYDPQIGRFLSVDPLADDGQEEWSPYAAMGNNPAMMVDPLGLKANMETPSTRDVVAEIMSTGGRKDNTPGASEMGSKSWLGADMARESQLKHEREERDALAGNTSEVGYEAVELNDMTCNYAGEGAGEEDPQNQEGNTREIPRGIDPVDSKDPLKTSNGERVYTLDEFTEYNKGLQYEQIINQRRKSGGGAGGPKLRYVLNPKDGNIMDMRHVLVVGYGQGILIGQAVELHNGLPKKRAQVHLINKTIIQIELVTILIAGMVRESFKKNSK